MRALALILLLALACMAVLGRTHGHGLAVCRSGNGSSCAACHFGSDPFEVAARSPALLPNAVELELEQLHEAPPRAECCLARAPKQGPPGA